MTRRRQIALAILIGAGAFLYFQIAHRRVISQRPAFEQASSPNGDSPEIRKATSAASSNTSALTTGAEQSVAPEATTSSARTVPLAASPAPPVAETAESSSLPPATVVENMRTTIRQFGSMFGGNPVGTNPEITSALQGNNPKHMNFLKADGNRVNANGELVDLWGTPYFF